MEKNLMDAAKALEGELVTWRRAIHEMPELGMELPKTSAYVQKELENMGIHYETCLNDSCIVACLGSKNGKCILLRADMDALPIQEETNLPFSSKIEGKMHACGHDLHTAILLGAAKLLKERENQLSGTVKLLFQPGEEIFAGAKAAIEAGVLENPQVNAAFSIHVSPLVPNNVLIYGKEVMSSAYGFRIHIHGKGGHGSTPENCVDPITIGVHIHMALQELISRECTPLSHTALTVGTFQSGEAPNIIPEYAVLSGTLRTFNSKIAAFLIRRINEIVPAVANAYRGTATVEELYNVPAVICDPEFNQLLIQSITKNSELKFYELYHAMGSEDFAFISEKVPSSNLCLGCAPCEMDKAVAPHNPKTVFDEDCLTKGAFCYAQAAIAWLERSKQDGRN